LSVRPAAGSHPVTAERSSRWPSLLLGIFLLLTFSVALGGIRGVAEARLVDTDPYSWVNRVTELREGGDWFDDTLRRVNPPVGHKQHWSRPFDVVLLVGGLAGEPFVGFESALLAWAIVVPCVLGIATFAVLWWGFSDLLDSAGVEALALLAGLQIIIIIDGFMAGRSDHKALIGLLLVAVLAVSRRAFARDRSCWWPAAAGALSGLGLWVGTEFALVVVAVMLAVGLEWLFRANAALRRLLVYALMLAASALISLVLENGLGGSTHVRFDELSMVFPVFAGLAALACAVISAISGRLSTRWRRAAALVVAAGICGAILVTLFPGLVNGPLGNVDPLYERTRLRNIVEIQPVIDGSWRASLYMLTAGLSLAPFAVATAFRLWRQRTDVFARQMHLLAVPAAIYLPLALWQVRWLFALNLVLVVPAALTVQRLMHAAAPRARRVHLGMMAVAAAAALWWLPLLPLVSEVPPDRCDIDAAIAALNDPAGAGRAGVRLMALTDYGPEILFRTPHSVFSIPNHRHQPGFTATYTAMTATTSSARRILDRNAVDAVLVCTDDVERAFYGAAPGSFHTQLTRGDVPEWLHEVPVGGNEPVFRLYKVNHGDDGPP
jgi:hypothetical protein